MKSGLIRTLNLGALFLGLALTAGCVRAASEPPPQYVVATDPAVTPAPPQYVATTDPAAPPGPETTAPDPTAAPVSQPAESADPADDLANAPVTPLAATNGLPANVTLSPLAAEVAKLASSGVDEEVMMGYVTNSAGIFNLSAEDIIYLNDIGVPGPVVSAMLSHDQAVRAAGGLPTTVGTAPSSSASCGSGASGAAADRTASAGAAGSG
jgi:hypothetical protein